jgi:hypothetical protein
LRCHAITVSGFTMTKAERQVGKKRKKQIQSSLSQFRSFGLLGTER